MKGVMEMRGVMEMATIFGAALAIYAGNTVHTREEHLRGRRGRRIAMGAGRGSGERRRGVNELAYEKRAAMLVGML
eukprot:6245561-Alexandrium_andersonii.AAC.1